MKTIRQQRFLITSFLLISISMAFSQSVPLGQEELVSHLNEELSGEECMRNVEYIARLHRMRGSEDYDKATDFIRTKLRDYKLESIETIAIPTDGITFYGTQKSRLAWDVEFAELWEVEQQDGQWVHTTKVADWQSVPLVLAQDSESGEVTAELVDIGAGTSEWDYAGKEIQGKLVLTASQPGDIVPLAIKTHGAVGIISYAQNQVTAWWKENENLIRWGHIGSFNKTKSFAFMVSLKQARSFQERMQQGEAVRLHAKVIAGQHPGTYTILSAMIEGADPVLKQEEIAFTCHLDHPRPGANDNASGCMAILEVARSLKKLIDSGKIERPRRSLRFIWSPEIEGTTALLNYRPELASQIKFNIHMDMVGGGPETKAIFHVSRSPMSATSFINDVGESFGHFLNLSSEAFTGGTAVPYPLVAEEGGKEALGAMLGQFSMGSDFQVFSEGSFRIPSIYLHDWPDRYIHTNYDVVANIDPTKLKRSAFLGAASAYYLADLKEDHIDGLLDVMKRRVLVRSAELLDYTEDLPQAEAMNTLYYFWQQEDDRLKSIAPFAELSDDQRSAYRRFLSNLKSAIGEGLAQTHEHSGAEIVFARNEDIKGPMRVFGYNYFTDHYDPNLKSPDILNYTGRRGSGGEYSYEALNFVDGRRTVGEITNLLSAEFGTIPVAIVLEYLEALQSINVIFKHN